MRRQNALYLALAMTVTASASASELDFNIGDESVNAQVSVAPTGQQLDFGFGYIYQKGGTHVANLDVHARGRTVLGNLPTTVGIGLQGSAYDEGPVDGGALALGGYAQVQIPSVPGLSVRAGLHFAPSITSFGDSDNFFRWEASVGYRLIQHADVYLGYRQVKTNLEDGPNITLTEDILVGFRLLF